MQNAILVKIWSDSISEENLQRILSNAEEHEKQTWEKFIFLSSWSVKLWREEVKKRGIDDSDFSKSELASIGQQFLMGLYRKLSKNRLVWEILLDDYINSDYINTFLLKLWIWKLRWEKVKVFASRILRPCCRW